VLHARRQWRSWNIEAAEQTVVPEGESVFDHLQHLNLKPRGRKGSALLVIISGAFYGVHSEYYPLSLKENLEESINFDWQENIFQENERTLHFSGPPVELDRQVSVPVFSIQREDYDKLHQSSNAILFDTFAVSPDALCYAALLPPAGDTMPESAVLARSLDDENLQVHRFYRGAFLESAVIGRSSQLFNLFVENLKCYGEGEFDTHVDLICAPGERRHPSDPVETWKRTGLAVEARQLEQPIISSLLPGLLKEESIRTFDSEIVLKPWQIPRIAAPLAVLVLIFALYGIYQSHSAQGLAQTSSQLAAQIKQLQGQWKPVEEIQTRITKFREDQKTLSEFSREDYKLMELLSFLTQLTPDDTSLNYLSLRKGQLILRGESKSALKYLADLSKTEGLTDVKFASPVTRDPGTDQERFNVQLQLDMEKLKKSFDTLPPEPPPGTLSGEKVTKGSVGSKEENRGAPGEGEAIPEEVPPDQEGTGGEQPPEEGR
jgi:general secretion pathway protein L